jgi:hypothetical protein
VTPFDAAAAKWPKGARVAPWPPEARPATSPLPLATQRDINIAIGQDADLITPAGRLRAAAKLATAWGLPVIAADLKAAVAALEKTS